MKFKSATLISFALFLSAEPVRSGEPHLETEIVQLKEEPIAVEYVLAAPA